MKKNLLMVLMVVGSMFAVTGCDKAEKAESEIATDSPEDILTSIEPGDEEISENRIISGNEVVVVSENEVVEVVAEVVEVEPITTVYDIPYKNGVNYASFWTDWNPGTLTVTEDNGVFTHLAVYDDGDEWFQPVTVSWDASFNMSSNQRIVGYGLELGDINKDAYSVNWNYAGTDEFEGQVLNASEELLTTMSSASKLWDVVRVEGTGNQDMVYFKYSGDLLLAEGFGYQQNGICAYVINNDLHEVVRFVACTSEEVTDWDNLELVIKSVQFTDCKVKDMHLENPPMNQPAK